MKTRAANDGCSLGCLLWAHFPPGKHKIAPTIIFIHDFSLQMKLTFIFGHVQQIMGTFFFHLFLARPNCPWRKFLSLPPGWSARLSPGWENRTDLFSQQLVDCSTEDNAMFFSRHDRIMDTVVTRCCHGCPLPCGPGGCFTDEVVSELLHQSELAFINNYTGIAEIVSHPLLTQITQRMVDKSLQRTPLKFAFYTGHDSSILPVLLVLGIHEGRWPPYATTVVFELWKKAPLANPPSTLKDSYFRVVVNGKVVTDRISFCQEHLHHHGNLCPVLELIRWLSKGRGISEMRQQYFQLCDAKAETFENPRGPDTPEESL